MTSIITPLAGPVPRAIRRRRSVVPWAKGGPAERDANLGIAVALTYAVVLSAARAIDVSEDGKAMMAFSLLYFPALLLTAFARPLWFLLLAVAYLPFAKVYSLSLGGITGANMSNIILLLAPIAWWRRRERVRVPVRWGLLENLILLFAAIGSVAAVTALPFSDGFGEMLPVYRGWLVPLLYFFIARGLVRDRVGLLAVVRCLAVVAILVAGLTWIEGIDRGSRGSIESARVEGLMRQANQMGAFLVYYGAVALALGLAERRAALRVFFLGGFLVAARAVLFTFSRAAYLALAGGSTAVAFLYNPMLLVAGAAVGGVAVVANPALIPASVRERFEQTSEGTGLEGENAQLDKSSAYRLILWRAAGRMIKEQPVTGVGLGRFSYVVGRFTDVELNKNDPNDAHNAYLLVAAEMGIPGIIGMVAVLLGMAAAALRLYFRRGPPELHLIAVAFLGAWSGLVVSCGLGSRFGDESLIAYFWILCGLVAVARRLAEPPRRRRVPA